MEFQRNDLSYRNELSEREHEGTHEDKFAKLVEKLHADKTFAAQFAKTALEYTQEMNEKFDTYEAEAKVSKEEIKSLKSEVYALNHELNVAQKGYQFIGGHEATDERIAKEKTEKEPAPKSRKELKEERLNAQEKYWDEYLETKEKAKLMKTEERLLSNGHLLGPFNDEKEKLTAKMNLRAMPLEQRKSLVSDAVKMEKAEKRIDRLHRWEKRLDTVKEKVVVPTKQNAVAGYKTAKDLVVNPALETVGEITNSLVEGYKSDLKTYIGFANKAQKGLKNLITKHILHDNSKEGKEQPWLKVASRARNMATEATKNAISGAFGKVSESMSNTFKKWSSTFNKHLSEERDKGVDKNKVIENDSFER